VLSAEASCQVWSANFNLPNELGLQPAYHRLDVIRERGTRRKFLVVDIAVLTYVPA